MEVFVVFADEHPFPGLQGSAVDRKILHVVDAVDLHVASLRRREYDSAGNQNITRIRVEKI